MSMMIKVTQFTQEMRARLSVQWERLSARDQRAILVLSVISLLLVVYLVIILPLKHWNANAKVAAQQGYDDVIYTRKNIDVARRLESRQRLSASIDPVAVVSSSGRQVGIVLSRVQPVRQGVSVWIDEVSYHRLLGWLLQLHQRLGMNVKQLRLERLEAEGYVKAFLRLER